MLIGTQNFICEKYLNWASHLAVDGATVFCASFSEKSLSQPSTLNIHTSIKYNSIFCLKKEKERGTWKVDEFSLFFPPPSVVPAGKIITLSIDGGEALHFQVVAPFITTALRP